MNRSPIPIFSSFCWGTLESVVCRNPHGHPRETGRLRPSVLRATRVRPGQTYRNGSSVVDTCRAVWWPRAVALNPGYGEYQKLTDREIPVVFIDPVP
ncbi:MAG: nitroreductase/quinone reductase family protein [Actinomycetes bacterium]